MRLLLLLLLAGCPTPHGTQTPPDTPEEVDVLSSAFPIAGRKYCFAGDVVVVSDYRHSHVYLMDVEVHPAVAVTAETYRGTGVRERDWYKYATPVVDPCPSQPRSY